VNMIENESKTLGKVKLRNIDFIVVLHLTLMRGLENDDSIT